MVRKARDGTIKQAALLVPSAFANLSILYFWFQMNFNCWPCVCSGLTDPSSLRQMSNNCLWQGPVKCCCHGNMDKDLLTNAWIRKYILPFNVYYKHIQKWLTRINYLIVIEIMSLWQRSCMCHPQLLAGCISYHFLVYSLLQSLKTWACVSCTSFFHLKPLIYLKVHLQIKHPRQITDWIMQNNPDKTLKHIIIQYCIVFAVQIKRIVRHDSDKMHADISLDIHWSHYKLLACEALCFKLK